MTTPRAFLVSPLLAAVMLGAPTAFAEVLPRTLSAKEASAKTGAAVKLAQKTDDEDRKRKGKASKDAGGNKGAETARQKPSPEDRQNALKKKMGAEAQRQKPANDKRTEAQQAKEKVLRQRQEAEAARQNALKQRQRQEGDAKDKARKQKLEAEAARQKAAGDKRREAEQRARERASKQKQDADPARQDAMKYIRRQAEEAKEKARKQKLEAETARQNALKQQRQAEDAKEKARKQKLEAEAARAKAVQEKRLQEQQAIDRARQQKPDAARQQKDARKPVKFDRAKADQEFERARAEAQKKASGGSSERWRAESARKFEDVRKGRKTREVGSRNVIIEPDKRVIVRDNNRTFIRHDESRRVARKGREVRREKRKDGTWLVITAGLAGALIHSIMDDDGRVIRRSRRDRDGREYVLFDDRRSYGGRPRHEGPDDYGYYDDTYVDLPPPVIRIPRDRYIVEYDRASPDDLYDALNAPPVEDLGRGYSLDEIRQNYSILERMRRVDLNAVNFEFASWDVGPDQYPKLERIARAMQRILDRSPGELFLIEGHTDAVGNEIDNLSLSDRRAETVANILSDEFGVPPENLATQGYGEEYLKELTDGPSWINRRVAVRRITPLLSREGWDDDPS